MKCSVCGSEKNVTRFKRKIPLCAKHYKQMYRYGEIKKRTKFDPNEIIIKSDYAELLLYNKECEVIAKAKIDISDIDLVRTRKWYCSDLKYVVSDTYQKGEGLHRLITNCPKGKVVDHINRNPLDNRKNNLRICTQGQNMFNLKLGIDNKSGHVGVIYRKHEKKWFSYITVKGKQYSLGYYNSKEDAIKARLIGEKNYFGEFAPNSIKVG